MSIQKSAIKSIVRQKFEFLEPSAAAFLKMNFSALAYSVLSS